MIDKPITPSELVAAVRPCLPLGDIIGAKEWGDDVVSLKIRDSVFADICPVIERASALIIGAIWQSCERRGWIVQMFPAQSDVIVWRGPHDRHEAKGTSVLSLCAAYAAARKASEVKT